MNGKILVRSLYTTPLILSVNAPKQNTFAIDSLSGIKFTFIRAPYAGPSWGSGSTNRGKGEGATCGTGAGTLGASLSPFVVFFFHVLLIPFFVRFMCLLVVAGLGFKYFVTNSSKICGHFLRNLCIGLSSGMRSLACALIDGQISRHLLLFARNGWTLQRPCFGKLSAISRGLWGAGHTGAGSRLGWCCTD